MTKGVTNIFRSAPRVCYTAVPNRVANDERLSARALGVLYYILTKPPGWRVVPAQLGSRFNISYRMILSILAELQDSGYVKRELVQENYRIVGTRYLVSDEPGWFGEDPIPASEPFGDFPACGKTRQTEKRRPIEKKESNKLISSTAPVAPRKGFQEGSGKVSDTSRIGADQGTIQLKIAERLGPNVEAGFGILFSLAADRLDQLCAMQRRGTLDDRTLARVRLEAAEPS